MSIIYLAHDPGGYDVISPLVAKAKEEGWDFNFFCIGPAAQLDPKYASSEETFFSMLTEMDSIQLLVCGTSWGSDLEVRAIAEFSRRGVKTIAVLDFWSNYANRFRKPDGEFVFPDYYVIMDHMAYEEAVEAEVPQSILQILGHPGLDRWIELRNKGISYFAKERTRVLFLSQPLSVLYGESLGYTEQQVCEDLIQALHNDQNYEFRVKFHPKDAESFRSHYREIEIEGELSGLYTQFDIIVGMNSIGLLHASLAGRTVLSYQPGLVREDMCITNKLSITSPISSYQQLILKLKAARENLLRPYSGTQAFNQYPFWFDGKSVERVAAFIKEVAEQHEN